MLLFEEAAKRDIYPHVQFFASDLDKGSIARAREGLYPAAIEADVTSLCWDATCPSSLNRAKARK